MQRAMGFPWLMAALLWGLAATSAFSQNLFSPVVRINDRAITAFELDQREAFLRVLRAPGDLRALALEQLIDDRLRRDAAARLGISVPEEAFLEATEEFAGRANLSREELFEELDDAGIAEATVLDFVESGVLWREVVRARFGPQSQVTDAEVDRALALSSQTGGARVLVSEIILPALPANLAEAEALADAISEITSFDEFAAAARQYSASASRAQGGRLEWLPIGNLPPPVRAELLTLAPGEVTEPLRLDNALVMFQLRALEETDIGAPEAVSVEYARLLIAGGRTPGALSEAARIAGAADTCDDLYGVARGASEEQLQRVVLPLGDVPRDIAAELAKLDEGEVSTALTTNNGQALVFLMLCGRTLALSDEINREEIRSRLLNQRLATYADGYLAELRAEAFIVYEDPALEP